MTVLLGSTDAPARINASPSVRASRSTAVASSETAVLPCDSFDVDSLKCVPGCCADEAFEWLTSSESVREEVNARIIIMVSSGEVV